MLQGSEGSQVINIEIHGIIYQYFTQFNVIRADNERVREREREREQYMRCVLGVEDEILRFQRRVKSRIHLKPRLKLFLELVSFHKPAALKL